MRPQSGDVIGGKYRVIRLIGDGGMGSVYEAHHEMLGTNVALKFLHSELARRPGLSSRFLQEARVSARIQSPHVTRVTDVDQTPDGSPFIVMELLSGESLQDMLDRRSKLARDQAIDFGLQILAGLEAAHALGVVHRDLKPDNVFITPSTGGPVLKLLDFGIAKLYDTNEYKKGLTRPGAIMGTPEYMAPEQLYSADKVDHRADLYSIGVLLYEMLTGERPAYGDDAAAIVGQVAQGKIRRLTEHDASLKGPISELVHRGMAPEKEKRFASAAEMRLALANLAGELSQAGKLAATPPPAAVSSAPPPPKQTKTEELPPLAPKEPTRPSTVAKTLPPEDADTEPVAQDAPQGSTQEASKELIAELSRQTAQRQAVPEHRTAQAHPPMAVTPPPAGMAGGPGGPPGGGFGPPGRKKRGGGVGALVALLLGLLVTGGVIALVVVLRDKKDDPTPVNPLGDPTPTTTIAPQGGSPTVTTPPPPFPAPGPAPTATTPKPGGGPIRPIPKRDGGKADSGAGDAGTVAPFPTFPLPSGLPPLPTIPTTIPTFPTWPPPPQNP